MSHPYNRMFTGDPQRDLVALACGMFELAGSHFLDEGGTSFGPLRIEERSGLKRRIATIKDAIPSHESDDSLTVKLALEFKDGSVLSYAVETPESRRLMILVSPYTSSERQYVDDLVGHKLFAYTDGNEVKGLRYHDLVDV
jgi:hypothetical protein